MEGASRNEKPAAANRAGACVPAEVHPDARFLSSRYPFTEPVVRPDTMYLRTA